MEIKCKFWRHDQQSDFLYNDKNVLKVAGTGAASS